MELNNMSEVNVKDFGFKSFRDVIKRIITFNINKFNLKSDYLDFYHNAYIEYKTFVKELGYKTPAEWAKFFWEEFDIDDHGFCLSSKLKPLRDLVNKRKKRKSK